MHWQSCTSLKQSYPNITQTKYNQNILQISGSTIKNSLSKAQPSNYLSRSSRRSEKSLHESVKNIEKCIKSQNFAKNVIFRIIERFLPPFSSFLPTFVLYGGRKIDSQKLYGITSLNFSSSIYKIFFWLSKSHLRTIFWKTQWRKIQTIHYF